MKYLLKNGIEVESVPIGNTSVKIGEISPDGLLTVCDRGPNNGSGRGAMVICKCQCGNYTMIKLNAFRNGSTKSCGCYGREAAAERMRKVGQFSKEKDYSLDDSNPFYKFIRNTGEKDSCNSFIWEIECKKCHQHYYGVPVQLISQKHSRRSNPCNCWRQVSKGVLKITDILEKNNISFQTEYSFTDCLSPKGNPMKFDFFVNNSYIIEYDGEQHYQPESFGINSLTEVNEKFTQQLLYDEIKNNYCKEKGIPIIRIPYYSYKDINLSNLLLETTQFRKN